MTEIDRLYAAVALMRRLQKQYFANRDHTVLERCKNAEREVDRLVEQRGQKQMFETDSNE